MSSATGANSSAARDTPGGMFVLRFDDLCPTMNWAAWDAIEQTLMELQVKPILAVVPDNRDNKLRVGPSNERFWERMRACQTRGWTVALHGYQHTYVNRNPGILGIWPQSEFAGLPAKEQERKILTGLQIFRKEGLEADTWVAPSHSFDWETVDILARNGIRIISDGHGQWPFRDKQGIFWLPLQLWRLMDKPEGVWTVCHHVNSWSQDELAQFRASVREHSARIISVAEAVRRYGERRRGAVESLAARLEGAVRFRMRWTVKRLVRPRAWRAASACFPDACDTRFDVAPARGKGDASAVHH
jgi:predicted deacetylase